MRLRRFDRDVGLVLLAFAALLVAENLVLGFAYRREFVSTWEMASARWHLSPIALAISVPVAVALVLLDRLATAGREAAVAFVGALVGLGVGLGVSTGRRMASLAVRAPFALGVALAVGLLFYVVARALPKARPGLVAALATGIAVAAWIADATVLPRLYPVFHLALFFVVLAALAAASRALRASFLAAPLGLVGVLLGGVAIAATPTGAWKAQREDNLRRILLEHAPVLGRAVRVAAQIAPPPPLDEDDEASRATLAGLHDRAAGAHAVDWRGHDIVVVTIDALRADHVSAYGYERKTTPNIDALAARGVRFDHAYCPTPHTSYSIASLMAGKYMKPLLALSPEEDSVNDTWAMQLRRYGYRTGAFYPPAVFFIDEHRFRHLATNHLGFEYAKVEFAKPELRREQIDRYLASAPKDKPLFLWVHLFEPHEPYEAHPEHPFTGDPRVDAYDSEIATADALVGDVVALVGKHRAPGTVFMVSADHGEEHGDHGGRYHGTTVYEEQVRVPLVVVAPGLAPRVVTPPVQTIDLLPTTLAALEVPLPPRLRGRDLGPLLAGREAKGEEGLAFAETDDYTLVARGPDRLVCARKIGSCTLFDVAHDPDERSPVGDRPGRVMELRKLGGAIQRETGKLEASALPEALRRAMQGDHDAAEDVAPLLDDAKVDLRRLAARAAFTLHAPELRPQLERAFARDEDDAVKRWAALALVRTGEGDGDEKAARVAVEGTLRTGAADEKLAAALALAERGDGRGEGELLARWAAGFGPDAAAPGEPAEARELLAAFVKIKATRAVPMLVRAIEAVELRPYVVQALADLGDGRARAPVVKQLAEERYVHLRPVEARAALKLGGRHEIYAPLARFAGVPEPMVEAIAIARDARLLTYDRGGKDFASSPGKVVKADDTLRFELPFPKPGPARLLFLVGPGRTAITGTIDGAPLPEAVLIGENVFVVELGELKTPHNPIVVQGHEGILAAWLVARAPEIPPPPPRAWKADADAGAPDEGL